MGKQKQPIMIIGEGVTEFYYFNSLRDVLRGIQFAPEVPKHSSLKELARKIEDGIAKGYAKIFCVIDMDNKDAPTEKRQYQELKRRYVQPVSKPKQGIYCEVKFFETHRCTELFFLYYFAYTAKHHATQTELIQDINQYCEYNLKSATIIQYTIKGRFMSR